VLFNGAIGPHSPGKTACPLQSYLLLELLGSLVGLDASSMKLELVVGCTDQLTSFCVIFHHFLFVYAIRLPPYDHHVRIGQTYYTSLLLDRSLLCLPTYSLAGIIG
jgi:hypothetical protein